MTRTQMRIEDNNKRQIALLKVCQKGREFVLAIETLCPRGLAKSRAFHSAQQAIVSAEEAILESHD